MALRRRRGKETAESEAPSADNPATGIAANPVDDKPRALEIPYQDPPVDSIALDKFAVIRQRHVRQQLAANDIERRIGRCVDALLSAAELPANPFPPLVKMLRQEELSMTEQVTFLPAQGTVKRGLWRGGAAQPSQLNANISRISPYGAAWRPLAPLVGSEHVQITAAGLASSSLLASVTRVVNTEDGAFSLKTCCSVTGSHTFAGRILSRPRTLELREHVQVRGPASRLEAALAAFADHVCSAAVSLQASDEHFVIDLEVYTGDGDVFDDEASADGYDGRATTNNRGTPERFGLSQLTARSPALCRALQSAVLAQLPPILNILICIPAIDLEASDESRPPRWHYISVQKAFCFFYEPATAATRTSASSHAAPIESHQNSDRPVTPFPRFQQYPLQSLFHCLWTNDADASWYCGLRENRTGAAGNQTLVEARSNFVAFLRKQVSRLIMRGDHLSMLELLLLLVPEVLREQRDPLLAEMRSFFTSDAAMLADMAHQSDVMQRVLSACQAPAVPARKREYALDVLRRQYSHVADTLSQFCTQSRWADVEPVKGHLLAQLCLLGGGDATGKLDVCEDTPRILRRLRRICHALHQVLADTFSFGQSQTSMLLQQVWDATKLDVPVSLQPPSVRSKVVLVEAERARQRSTRMYPSTRSHEAVLVQYAADTNLDTALHAALADVCSAHVVTGNPMHAVLQRLKAFAHFFEVWRETDDDLTASLCNRPVLTDVRLQIFSLPLSVTSSEQQHERASVYLTASERWSALARSSGLHGAAGAHNDSRVESTVFGMRHTLLLVDSLKVISLCNLLADFMPAKTANRVQQYECIAHMAFCGDVLPLGRYASLHTLNRIEMREDHFVRGPIFKEALAIQSQHIVHLVSRLHNKTKHIVRGLHMGATFATVQYILQDPRLARADIMRALMDGTEIRLEAYALVTQSGTDPRYVTLTIALHLCHLCSTSKSESMCNNCSPTRMAQLFESIFMSREHMLCCLEAEGIASNPALGWRARKWLLALQDRAAMDMRDGFVLSAAQARLQHELFTGSTALVPGVGRLMSSPAARLRALSDASTTIQRLLDCTDWDENRMKCNHKVLSHMFNEYRGPVIDMLTSDSCCNCMRTRPPESPFQKKMM